MFNRNNQKRTIKVTVSRDTYNKSQRVLMSHGTNVHRFTRNNLKTTAEWPRLKKVWSDFAFMLMVQLMECLFISGLMAQRFPKLPAFHLLIIAIVYLGLKLCWIMYNVEYFDPSNNERPVAWWQFL